MPGKGNRAAKNVTILGVFWNLAARALNKDNKSLATVSARVNSV